MQKAPQAKRGQKAIKTWGGNVGRFPSPTSLHFLLLLYFFEMGVPGDKNPEVYALGRCPRLQNGQKSQLVEQIR